MGVGQKFWVQIATIMFGIALLFAIGSWAAWHLVEIAIENRSCK